MTRPNAANRTPDCRQRGCGAARGRVHQGASSIILSDVRGVSARLISLSHKSHPPSLSCSMRSLQQHVSKLLERTPASTRLRSLNLLHLFPITS